jgi:hypothetical protein
MMRAGRRTGFRFRLGSSRAAAAGVAEQRGSFLRRSEGDTHEMLLKQILQELKDAIASGQLDSIIKLINDLTVNIDGSIAKVENTLERLVRGITKDTSKSENAQRG